MKCIQTAYQGIFENTYLQRHWLWSQAAVTGLGQDRGVQARYQGRGQTGAAGSHTVFLKDMLIPTSLDRWVPWGWVLPIIFFKEEKKRKKKKETYLYEMVAEARQVCCVGAVTALGCVYGQGSVPRARGRGSGALRGQRLPLRQQTAFSQ